MKNSKNIIYKGFEINVYKGKCLAGYDLIYYTVHRLSDGWYLADGWYDIEVTIAGIIEDIKCLVNDYLAFPEDYED